MNGVMNQDSVKYLVRPVERLLMIRPEDSPVCGNRTPVARKEVLWIILDGRELTGVNHRGG